MRQAPDDRLTLGAIEAQCDFFGPAADAYAVERRLDRVAREILPDALASSIAGHLGRQQGVIRIDRIELDLVLSREMFEGSALPQLWAERIGTALAAALARGDSPGVVHFAGYGEFVAAYLEQRFGVARHPDFAFLDFAPLAHLAAAEAAAELLAARPDFLAALACSGAGRRDPAWLARRLAAGTSSDILDGAAASPRAADGATLGIARRLVAHAPAGWQALPGAAAALALVLGAFAGAPAPAVLSLEAVAPIARALAALAKLAVVAPELVDLIEVDDPNGTIEFLSLGAADRRETAFAQALFSGRAGQRIAASIHALLGTRARPNPDPASAAKRRPKRGAEAVSPSLDSPFAGFALLLPTLRQIGADTLLSPGQARALIGALLDPPIRAAAQADALADMLLPLPIEPEPPPWPQAAADDPASASAEGWARRALEAFGERLPGLRGSSGAYLRRQFLCVGGSLELGPRQLTVRLNRPPLAIVLTIGGMIGDQGALPWRRERSMRILMP